MMRRRGTMKYVLKRLLTDTTQKKFSRIDDLMDLEIPEDKTSNKEILTRLLRRNKRDNVFIEDGSLGNDNPKYRTSRDKKDLLDSKFNIYNTGESGDVTDTEYRGLTPDEVSKKNIIHLKNPSYTAAAHEIDHTKFQRSKVGGLLHKVQRETKSPISSGDLGAAVGLVTGARSEKLKREGRKEGFLSKNAHWMIPVVANTPKLIEEGSSSAMGLNELKKVGVKGSRLGRSRSILANAFGTYALPVGKEILKGVAGRAVGKSAGRSYYKIKDKITKKKDKNQEDPKE